MREASTADEPSKNRECYRESSDEPDQESNYAITQTRNKPQRGKLTT